MSEDQDQDEIENFFKEIKNSEEIELIKDNEYDEYLQKIKGKSWKKKFDKLVYELIDEHDFVSKIIDQVNDLISNYVDDLASKRFEVHKKMKELNDKLPEEEKKELKKVLKWKLVNNKHCEGYYIPDRDHAWKYIEGVLSSNFTYHEYDEDD